MTDTLKSKMLAPVDIYKVLKSAHDNGRLEDNLAQIAREIARLDPAYVAFAARNDAKTLKEMVEEACTFGVSEQPADIATSGVEIRKLEWVLENEFWKCTTHTDYNIECWWEVDVIKTPRDYNDPHYFVINDDDDERYETIEEAMDAAQTIYETVANSYFITRLPAQSDDEKFKAGRKKGLVEGAKIAGDFVYNLYDNDGVVTSHDYEKVRDQILQQIEQSTHEDTEDAAPSPR
jgi:hypothetical protein